MIWATVTSQSCFADCIELFYLWLQRIQSIQFWYWPSGDVHVYNLLLHCWKRVFAMISVFSSQNSVRLCTASFCTSKVTPGISWFPIFAFQSSLMKKTSFVCVSSRMLVDLHGTIQHQLFSFNGQGIDLDNCYIEWFALETNGDHSAIFETASKYCISDSSVDYESYSISSKGFLPQL